MPHLRSSVRARGPCDGPGSSRPHPSGIARSTAMRSGGRATCDPPRKAYAELIRVRGGALQSTEGSREGGPSGGGGGRRAELRGDSEGGGGVRRAELRG